MSSLYSQETTLKKTRKKPTPDLNGSASNFDLFWAAYPKKEDKKMAMKAWIKLHPSQSLLDTILLAISQQKQTAKWQEDKGRFIPYPTTYLNGKRWEDEIAVIQKPERKFVY